MMGDQVGPSQLDMGDDGQKDGDCRSWNAGPGGGADWPPDRWPLWPCGSVRTKLAQDYTETAGPLEIQAVEPWPPGPYLIYKDGGRGGTISCHFPSTGLLWPPAEKNVHLFIYKTPPEKHFTTCLWRSSIEKNWSKELTHKETIFHCCYECQRLSTLFLFLQAVFLKCGGFFSKQSFILDFRFTCHQKHKCQL